MVSKTIIDQALANIGNRQRPFLMARPFTDYAPLSYVKPQVADPSQYGANVAAIGQGATTQHEQVMERAANRTLLDIRNAKRQQVNQLQNQLGNLVGEAPRGAETVVRQRPSQTNQGQPRDRNRWGRNDIPEVSDIGKLRPNAPIVTRDYRGIDYQVNKQVAPIFQAFLRNLGRAGYRPAVIQGHNERNIAGTNTPSLHSYGFAIDIDPTKNPVQDSGGRMQTTLPPRVAAIAAKYGLAWGGSWNSYKDPMHFSVPFRGRE